MPRRSTQSLVLTLSPRLPSSPASTAGPSSSSRAFDSSLPQLSAPCTALPPLLPPPPSKPPITASDMNIVSQFVPCLPTVFKLGLVTPDTPSFPFGRDGEGEEAHDSKRLRSSQARKEGTPHTMDSHIPTPTLTNSPGSPLEMEYSYEEFERYLPLSSFPTPPLSDPYSPEPLAGLNFEDALSPELYGGFYILPPLAYVISLSVFVLTPK